MYEQSLKILPTSPCQVNLKKESIRLLNPWSSGRAQLEVIFFCCCKNRSCQYWQNCQRNCKNSTVFNNTVTDPGIPRRGRGATIPEFRPKNFSFCRKLHENKRNWTERGARPWRLPWIRQYNTHHTPFDHSSAQLLCHRRRQHTGTVSFPRRSSLCFRDISYIPMTFCSKANIWNSLKLLLRNTVPGHTLQFKRDIIGA